MTRCSLHAYWSARTSCTRTSRASITVLVGALLFSVAPSMALDKDDLFIHGFGSWAFGDTDGNRYLIGEEDGRYDNVQFSLNIAATPHERVSIVTQVDFEQRRDDLETELDFAFVELSLLEHLKLRLGRVKHPYGLYAEVFDVGTIRPFHLLPQSIYGPNGITAQSYDGAGLRGRRNGARWGLEWDVYAGAFQGEIRVPGPISGNPEDVFASEAVSDIEVDDVIGGRLNISTPIDGLMFGISGYSGEQTITNFAQSREQAYDVLGGHVEYLDTKWSIRAEFAHFELENGNGFKADAIYAEVGYFVTEKWELAARYDDFEGSLPPDRLGQLPPFASQFFVNTDVGVGINYWYSTNLVLRLNAHFVEGNRFAFPLDSADIMQVFQTGMLEEDTTLVLFGTQFSF